MASSSIVKESWLPTVDNLRNLFLTRTICNRLLACGRSAAEADDVAIRILDIEALPLGRRDRLDDRHAVGECFSRNRLTPELTGAGDNTETIQVNDER